MTTFFWKGKSEIRFLISYPGTDLKFSLIMSTVVYVTENPTMEKRIEQSVSISQRNNDMSTGLRVSFHVYLRLIGFTIWSKESKFKRELKKRNTMISTWDSCKERVDRFIIQNGHFMWNLYEILFSWREWPTLLDEENEGNVWKVTVHTACTSMVGHWKQQLERTLQECSIPRHQVVEGPSFQGQ